MKICLLGNSSLYTKIVCKKFDELNIEYSLIIEKSNIKKQNSFFKFLSIPLKLERMLNSGKYKGLSKISFFTYKLLIKDILFNKSNKKKSLIKEYINYTPKAKSIYYTVSVNHITTAKIVEDNYFDIGVFAGVGIVDGLIIETFNEFCLNGHPAPLPNCRGGGALQNTFYYELEPSVSIHYGTTDIDEGEILKVEKLREIDEYDTFNSVSLKLSILCGEVLAKVTKDLLDNKEFQIIENKGKLHYWKDCNKNIQKKAFKNFDKMLKQIK